MIRGVVLNKQEESLCRGERKGGGPWPDGGREEKKRLLGGWQIVYNNCLPF